MEKFAVVSDIHGNVPALEEVAADIKKRGIQKVINLGDHLSGPLWVKETADYLIKSNWIHIAGNHDRQLINSNPSEHGLSDKFAYKFLDNYEKEWLRSLETEKLIDNEIFICHGAPGSDTTYLLETVEYEKARLSTAEVIKRKLGGFKAQVILCGHTHVPRIVTIDEDMLILNPGSVGLQAYDDVLPDPHVIENGSPHARYMILEKRDNNWFAELIILPYDYERAAQQARINNRSDWEVALRTGYMKL